MRTSRIAALFPFCLFSAFGLGIVLGRYLPFFWVFFSVAIACVVSIIAFYKKDRNFLSDLFILLLFISLGGAWVLPSVYQSQGIDNIVGARFLCPVKIKVVVIPQEKANHNVCYAVIRPFNKRVRVMDYARRLEYLHSYAVGAKISRRGYNGRDFYTLWIKRDTEIKELPLPFWDKYKWAVNNYVLGAFKNNLSSSGYRFMASVFLGRRELLGEEKSAFLDAGASHLLAISGLHVGVTALVLFFILRMFGVKFRMRLVVSLGILWLYTLLTGPSSSTLRAAVMYSVFVLGFFFQRRINLFNSLGIAGIVSLIIGPLAMFGVGFQLSFLSVFAIVLWAKLFPLKPEANVITGYIKQVLFCSFVVAVFLAPVVSYYFGRLYLLTVFYNIVLIPFFTVILIINFIFIIFSPYVFAAGAVGRVLSLVIELFIRLSRFLGGVRGSFIEYSVSAQILWLYYLILFLFLVVYFRKLAGPYKKLTKQ